MKTIEVDEELYRYIASHTQHIGESASDILRRMLKFTAGQPVRALPAASAPQSVELEKAAPAQRPRDRVRAMRELLLSDEYAEQNKAVNRFMLVLSTLYTLDAAGFAAATEALTGVPAPISPAISRPCWPTARIPSRSMYRAPLTG